MFLLVKKLLLQLDTSPLASVFDRVVAHDGGADDVMAYGGITPETVRDLVHGCIFTRRTTWSTSITCTRSTGSTSSRR